MTVNFTRKQKKYCCIQFGCDGEYKKQSNSHVHFEADGTLNNCITHILCIGLLSPVLFSPSTLANDFAPSQIRLDTTVYLKIPLDIGIYTVLNSPVDNEVELGENKTGMNISLYTVHIHMIRPARA